MFIYVIDQIMAVVVELQTQTDVSQNDKLSVLLSYMAREEKKKEPAGIIVQP